MRVKWRAVQRHWRQHEPSSMFPDMGDFDSDFGSSGAGSEMDIEQELELEQEIMAEEAELHESCVHGPH